MSGGLGARADGDTRLDVGIGRDGEKRPDGPIMDTFGMRPCRAPFFSLQGSGSFYRLLFGLRNPNGHCVMNPGGRLEVPGAASADPMPKGRSYTLDALRCRKRS